MPSSESSGEARPRSGSHSLRIMDVHGRPNRVRDLLKHTRRSGLKGRSQTSKAREGSRPPWVHSHRYQHPLRSLGRPVAGWPVTSRAARVGFDGAHARARSVLALPALSRLYFRLIRGRSWVFARCREEASAQVTDGADRTRTDHRSPENRKVDGSTPSLATTLTSVDAGGSRRTHRAPSQCRLSCTQTPRQSRP